MAIAGPVTITAFLIGTLLSGCSGGPGATDTDVGPTPSRATTTASASPSTTPGVLDDAALARIPKAARAHTPAGAEAFARFYLDQVNKAWMAPDPDLIRPYALETCKTCANYVATAEWLGTKHLSYSSVPSALGPSGVLPESDQHTILIQVVQQQLPVTLLRQDGSVEREVPKDASLLDLQVLWRLNAWRVASIKGEHA